jgi:hypothetical protein
MIKTIGKDDWPIHMSIMVENLFVVKFEGQAPGIGAVAHMVYKQVMQKTYKFVEERLNES